MIARLATTPLDISHCQSLAKSMVEADAFECMASGHTPFEALATGCALGPAYAVIRSRTHTPVGAFGCTPKHATIWSLWGPLGLAEQREVLRGAPEWIDQLVIESGCRTLHNFVPCAHEKTIKWLHACRRFRIDKGRTVHQGTPYHFFETIDRHV